ncbi:MAG: hypothetical protein V3V14_01265 [Saprospiraceae bacterium]
MQKEVVKGKENCHIYREQGLFVKSGKFLAQEYKNTQIGAQLSKDSKGLFLGPKPISFDNNTSKITFEFIPDMLPLFALDTKDKELEKKVALAGRALAYIHTNGHKYIEEKVHLFFDFDSDNKFNGFFHGDFNLQNVQYLKDDIYIIDWSLSPLLDNTANYGCVFHDVQWFIASIFTLKNSKKIFNTKARIIADIFLDNYLQNYNCSILDIKKFVTSSRKNKLVFGVKYSFLNGLKIKLQRFNFYNYWKTKS